MKLSLKGMVQDKMQDTLMVGVMVLSFVWLIGIQSVLPQYAGVLGPVGYLMIIFFGIFGVNLIVREHVNSFPYIDIHVRPSNDHYHAFLEPPGDTRKIAPNQYVTTLNLRFPIDFEGDMVDRIELHHTGRWSDRIRFNRGYCVYGGLSVPHPQTEEIEVSIMPKTSSMIDHDTVVPIFILRSASLDYYKTGELDVEELHTSDDLKNRIKTLTAQLAEAYRRIAEWHQRAVSAEEKIDQQKAEIRGLMSAKSGLRELAYEYMLTIYQACGSIEKALAHLKGQTLTDKMLKYAMITIIGVAALGWMWYNPDAVTTLAANTLFLVTLLIVAIVGGIVFFYMRGRKSGIP